jgi:hypothetical protein
MNKAVDEVRSAEAKQIKRDGYGRYLPESRWSLLKRPENLTAKQKLKLRDLVRYNLQPYAPIYSKTTSNNSGIMCPPPEQPSSSMHGAVK